MPPILQMRGIKKRFGGIQALSNVNLDVQKAEIHAVCGENGAGKSTLMNILSGVYPYGSYEGSIFYEGSECRFSGVRDSEQHGIVIIHQEFALVPALSIVENIFLGHEPAAFGLINRKKMIQDARVLMHKVGLYENPHALVADIGVSKQQLVEIAKAFSRNVKLLVLDEPTACLSETDSQALLNLLVELKNQGMTSILISHKIEEIKRVADRITVIRDGQTIETFDSLDFTEDRIIRSIVGRTIKNRYPKRSADIGDVIFEVRNWSVAHSSYRERKIIKDISLFVRKGEVVGLAGLMGAGRTEFAMSVFGHTYGVHTAGQAYLRGESADTSTVQKAIASGLAYVTEDRKNYGLNLRDHIRHNLTIANLCRVSSKGIIDRTGEIHVAREYIRKIKIHASGVHQCVENLSGGNQQKVLLSKWLFTDPDVLILDEPTRGVDVGAKYEIYRIINMLAEEGRAILLISSDMPELLGICDRLYVLRKGRIAAEMTSQEASQENIMRSIVAKEKGQPMKEYSHVY